MRKVVSPSIGEVVSLNSAPHIPMTVGAVDNPTRRSSCRWFTSDNCLKGEIFGNRELHYHEEDVSKRSISDG